jgi:hypothetical protein
MALGLGGMMIELTGSRNACSSRRIRSEDSVFEDPRRRHGVVAVGWNQPSELARRFLG